MDSIHHINSLVTDIPSWLLILDEQNEQIGRRQSELARVAGASLDRSFSSTRSLRNKGSAESLRPAADDRLAEEDEEEARQSHDNEDSMTGEAQKESGTLAAASKARKSCSPKATSQRPRTLQRNMSASKKGSKSVD